MPGEVCMPQGTMTAAPLQAWCVCNCARGSCFADLSLLSGCSSLAAVMHTHLQMNAVQ